MKNIFKIIFILCLGIFGVAGCADDSNGNGGGNTENTGEDNNGKLISLGGLSYRETADGKKYVWGNAGELAGAGNKDNVTTPVEVDLTVTDNITNNGTYYVLTDTGLYAWGDNEYGQVGNGTTDDVLTPYKVEGITGNIKEVITDENTVYVLTDTGLYAWGNNRYGQVDNGMTTDRVTTPYKVGEGITGNIKDLIISGSSNDFTYYVLTDSGLYAWGDNYYGQVGNGTTTDRVTTPYKVEGITGNIKEVITSWSTVYVLTEDGLYAWGRNGVGQVGNGNTDNVLTPYKVEGITGNIKEVITGNNTVYVLTDTGLYAWGYNLFGQVGSGVTTDYIVLTPYKVEGITGNIKEVITDENTVYVLTDTGLYAWGWNRGGQAGNGNTDNVLTPYKAVNGNIKEFIILEDTSFSFTYYVLTEDGLYAWGNNRYGQVGSGTTDDVLTPYKAVNGNIKDLIISGSSNDATYYVLTEDGLYAWGNNYYGQVGNGDSGFNAARVLTPYKVEGITGNIKEVITGNNTVYVLTDTCLYAWGYNYYGQVGSETNDDVLTPYKVEGITGNIKEVITDENTVYVLTDSGLYAWGYNYYGQVGNGTTKSVLTPYEVKIEKQN